MNKEVKLLPYVMRFALAYAVAIVVVTLVLQVLGVNQGAGGSVAALLAAVVFTVSKFVKDQQRVPDRGERNRLAWSSLAATWLISLLLAGILVVVSGQANQLAQLRVVLSQFSIGLIVGTLLVACALYFLILWFAYGWLAKSQYRAMLNKGRV